MTHELPSKETPRRDPEVYRRRQRAIDVGPLSTDEIKRLGRGLGIERRERLNRSEVAEGDVLVDILGAAIRRKAASLPRGEAIELVRDLAMDADAIYIRQLAAYALPVVVQYDYEFARDTLIELAVDRDGEYPGVVSDARWEIEQSLPPEQQADLLAHYKQRWNETFPGVPIE